MNCSCAVFCLGKALAGTMRVYFYMLKTHVNLKQMQITLTCRSVILFILKVQKSLPNLQNFSQFRGGKFRTQYLNVLPRCVTHMCPGVDLVLSPSFLPPGPSGGSWKPHRREDRQCTWIRPYKNTDLILPLSLPLVCSWPMSEPSGCGCCHCSHPRL